MDSFTFVLSLSLATTTLIGCAVKGDAVHGTGDKVKRQDLMKYSGRSRTPFRHTVTVAVGVSNPRDVGAVHYRSKDGSRFADRYSRETPNKIHDYRYEVKILVENKKGEVIAPVFPVEREVMDDDGNYTTIIQWSSVSTSASTLTGLARTRFPTGPEIRKYILVLRSFTEKTGSRIYEFEPDRLDKKAKALIIPDLLSLEALSKSKRSERIKSVVRAAEKEEEQLEE